MLKSYWPKVKYAVWWILHEWIYDFNYFLGRFLSFTLSDCTVIGQENIPRDKIPVMLTPNHLSNWDLPYIHNLAPRSFYTMGKEEFLRIPILGGICRLMGAFPVKRGTPDRRALQTSINVLKEGNMFLIFPEGTRSKTQTLNEGHGGAAMIALAADAWIIPVALTGTEYIYRKRKGLLSRPKVTVRVGKPYKLSRLDENGRKLSADEMGDQIMEHIAELLSDEYRGKYSREAIAERKAARLQASEAHSARRATRKAGP